MKRKASWAGVGGLVLLALAGCRAASRPSERPVTPQPPPIQQTVAFMGQEDAARLGAAYASDLGYQVELVAAALEAETWVLRYAVIGRPRKTEQIRIDIDARTRTVKRLLDRELESETGGGGQGGAGTEAQLQ